MFAVVHHPKWIGLVICHGETFVSILHKVRMNVVYRPKDLPLHGNVDQPQITRLILIDQRNILQRCGIATRILLPPIPKKNKTKEYGFQQLDNNYRHGVVYPVWKIKNTTFLILPSLMDMLWLGSILFFDCGLTTKYANGLFLFFASQYFL